MKPMAVGLALLVLAACSSGGPGNPASLSITPMEGPPGTVLTITGLELSADDNLEVWVGAEPALARLENGTISAAIPLFLGQAAWPEPPTEPQIVEVRRGAQVLGRSAGGVTVTELPRAPGSTQEVQEALAHIADAYEAMFARLPVASEAERPVREGVVAMLKGIVSEGENSLQAVLEGTAPVLKGVEADTALADAILASSGALAYVREYATALAQAQQALSSQTLSPYCDGDGEDFALACKMQIYVVLDDYSRAFVKPTAKTYANTVGLAAGLLAMGTVTVPPAAIIGAILSVADLVMEKIAPALFPSKLSQFELDMPRPGIDIGETTVSRIRVSAVNAPPQITYLDIFEQVKALAGAKNITFSDKFHEVLKATAEFALDLYLRLIKAYEGMYPGTYPWATAGDIRIPEMSWGPVEVRSDRLVTLFSFDESTVRTLEQELEWQGVKFGEAKVRVMPRGPGERSKVLRDHVLCLGCVYVGGAFGLEMPESSVTVVVGELRLTATPDRGKAPLTTTFSWTGLTPQEEPLTCILDVGDGSTFYTIQDCANTTTQTHTYPYTSALQSISGTFEAELKVVGSERIATAEVRADWVFTASPATGEAPLDVTFTWGGFDPEGGAFSCRLEPGDGAPVQTIDDCLNTATASHRYTKQGSYTATLIVTGSLRQDFKSVPVTVTEESASCEGIENVESWTGSASMSYSGYGQEESSSVSVERSADVSLLLGDRGEFGNSVWWGIEVTRGYASINDIWTTSTRAYPITGSGSPRLRRDGGLYLNKTTCTFSFHMGVSVEAQNYWAGGVAPSTVAYMQLRSVELSGGASLQVYAYPTGFGDGSGFALQRGAQYTEGYGDFLAQMIGEENLGTAAVTWSFTPAE